MHDFISSFFLYRPVHYVDDIIRIITIIIIYTYTYMSSTSFSHLLPHTGSSTLVANRLGMAWAIEEAMEGGVEEGLFGFGER